MLSADPAADSEDVAFQVPRRTAPALAPVVFTTHVGIIRLDSLGEDPALSRSFGERMRPPKSYGSITCMSSCFTFKAVS